jgi:hypothetical protein
MPPSATDQSHRSEVPGAQRRYTLLTRSAQSTRTGRQPGIRGGPPSAGLSSLVVVAPQTPPTGPTLARDVALYTVARLAMVAAMALILVLAGVPLLVSILIALVVALPLSMVLLGSLRARVNTGLAVVGERRRAERDRLRRQLRGD